MYLSDLKATRLHIRKFFIILVKTLTFIDWQNWCLHKGDVLATSSRTFIYTATKYAQKWYTSQLDK